MEATEITELTCCNCDKRIARVRPLICKVSDYLKAIDGLDYLDFYCEGCYDSIKAKTPHWPE